MRVLHVISSLDAAAGGTTAFVRGLAVAQAKAGLRVSVLSTWSGEMPADNAAFLNGAGVTTTLVGPATGRFARHPQLGAEIESAVAKADVVHVHAMWEEAQHRAARAARKWKVPYVISPHGMLDPWSLRQSKWAKRFVLAWRVRSNLKHAAALHFTCEVERDLVMPLKLGPPAIIEPPGLDFAEFDPAPSPGKLRDKFRGRFADIDSRPIVLFLSRVHPKKGLDLLIPAFAKVADSRALLVIAGPDPDGYWETVRSMARQNRIDERVVFVGMLRGIERIEALVDADLFALPSYQENFGIAVTESLAAGTPVVISDQVNIHTEITKAEVGAVVPTQIGLLAAALNVWLSDGDRRQAAGRRAAEFARQRYDWNAIARRWVDHYTHLIQPRPA